MAFPLSLCGNTSPLPELCVCKDRIDRCRSLGREIQLPLNPNVKLSLSNPPRRAKDLELAQVFGFKTQRISLFLEITPTGVFGLSHDVEPVAWREYSHS